jgi:L-threonylcarbamoyladenylate synthase
MQIIKYKDILIPKNLEIIRDIVENNGVIIYPTDTLYGLGGNFFSLAVIKTIDRIKNREDLPYSVAVSSIEMAASLVETIPPVFYDLYEKLLPGKFTLLFKTSRSLNKALVKNSDKIGIRIPGVPNILKLIETLNTPLISTSVNRSGEPPLNDPTAITRQFADSEAGYTVSLQIDAGILPESRGSTILDITDTPITCIRKGDDFFKLNELNIDVGVT